ncbi:MAG: MerR family transcriptional regulator [Deltaproteobacteria bacterium]|nr:MerR family transcriptional regulator [Deltaproteobacteria bacterium]
MVIEGRGSPALEKRFYKISEMAALAGVAPSVLRFWEGEFPQIRPKRTLSGQRVYRAEDAALIMRIKELLYDRRFTIPGARNILKDEAKKAPSLSPSVAAQSKTVASVSPPAVIKAPEAAAQLSEAGLSSIDRAEIVATLTDIRRMLV